MDMIKNDQYQFSSSIKNEIISICNLRLSCDLSCRDCKYYDVCGGTAPKTVKDAGDIANKYKQIIKKQYQQRYKTYEQ